jgi:TRAP-type mannitol/chloroaromatic compound transport system permease small subunit
MSMESTSSSLIGTPKARFLVRLSDGLRRFVDVVGRYGSLLILPLVFVTMFDVTIRKLVWIQLWLVENISPFFGSTLLQELEWHFHTALFALVLGYGSIHNSNVRVDLVREHLPFRKKTWLEFLGCSLFMLPYLLVVIYFAIYFAYDSFLVGEISASTVGLTHRWIIKTILVIGLIVAALAGLAIWLQTVIVLFGPSDLRFDLMTLEWPEEDMRIEGKERIVLDQEAVAALEEEGRLASAEEQLERERERERNG